MVREKGCCNVVAMVIMLRLCGEVEGMLRRYCGDRDDGDEAVMVCGSDMA